MSQTVPLSEGERSFPRCRRCAFVLVVVGLFAGLVWFLARQLYAEPVYRGKTLGTWLRTYSPSSGCQLGSPPWRETDDAVRHLGAGCIPTLLWMIRAKDSSLKLRLVALAQKQHFFNVQFVPAGEKNVEASRAFVVLGETAKGAVPGLIKAYGKNVTKESRCAIADAFSWIGPSARPAVPLLLRTATNSDPRLRSNALWALGEIHAQPDLCVPVLIRALGDSDGWTQLSAAHALGGFGADSRSAISTLTRISKTGLNSSRTMGVQAQVMLEALKALKKIGPEVESLPEFELPTAESPFSLR